MCQDNRNSCSQATKNVLQILVTHVSKRNLKFWMQEKLHSHHL